MEYSKLIKKHKRKPIYDAHSPTLVKVDYDRKDLERIIPNREPFVFIDKITAIDLEEKLVLGRTYIKEDDPVFKGHFPGLPVYPGVLQLEMTSEMFGSLYYFISAGSTEIIGNKPVNLRAIRMFDALLQQGVFPGDELTIANKLIDNTGITFTGISQILKGDQIVLVVMGEYYIVEQ